MTLLGVFQTVKITWFNTRLGAYVNKSLKGLVKIILQRKYGAWSDLGFMGVACWWPLTFVSSWEGCRPQRREQWDTGSWAVFPAKGILLFVEGAKHGGAGSPQAAGESPQGSSPRWWCSLGSGSVDTVLPHAILPLPSSHHLCHLC